MQRRLRKLLFEQLEARRPLAVTAVDDAYVLTRNGELNVGYEKAGYQSLIELQLLDIGNAAQLEFSDRFELLLMRSEDGKSIKAIDVNTRQVVSTQTAREGFTDMSLTADGRYLFVADFSGSGLPGAPPGRPCFVRRFDCSSRTWVTLRAPQYAFKVEAVSADRVLLQEENQHVDITLNTFDVDQSTMVELSRISGHYEGDIEFDARSGMIFHLDRGPARQIQVRRVVMDRIIAIESTLMYGSANGFGGTSVLSTDGLTLFYGRLQVEAADVINNLNTYSESIVAASSSVAFGEAGSFYDSRNGKLLGKISFPVGPIHVSANNRDVWIAEKTTGRVHRFLLLNEKLGVLANDLTDQGKQVTVKLETSPLHGSATINSNGSFSYIPAKGFTGTDSFRYLLTDESGATSRATVRLTIASPETQNRAPVAPDLEFHIDRGGQLRIEQATGAFNSGARQLAEFSAPGNVRQIEYSAATGLLALRNTGTKVRIIDPTTQRVVSERTANGNFTDMDLTPDGRYLMVADYNGAFPYYPAASFSLPRETLIQRYDMLTDIWTNFYSSSTVFRVEAISSERVLTENYDGPVDVVLNSLSSSDGKLLELNRFRVHDKGDIEYDNSTGRLYHSNSSNVYVLQVSQDKLVQLDSVNIDPFSIYQGGTVALSTDGKRLYSGQLQFDASKVHTTANVLRKVIYAASNELVFGENEIYDQSGSYLGKLDFVTDVHFASDDSRNWWTFDPATDRLRHYSLDGKRVGLLATANDSDGDSLSLELLDSPAKGSVRLIDKKGSVLFTPNRGFVGIDSFKYRVFDGYQNSGVRTVTIHIDDPAPIGQPPTTVDDRFVVNVGLQLNVGTDFSAAPQLRKVSDFNTLKYTTQVAVSDSYGIIAAATVTGVQIFDRKSSALISSLSTLTYVTQIDLTPDNRYLFVAERGGNIQDSRFTSFPRVTGTPRIHRYDIVSREWVSKEADDESTGRIEAISRNRVLLLLSYQQLDASLYSFTDDSQTPLLELDREGSFCYYGDVEYDWRTDRVYCGDSLGSQVSTVQVAGTALNQLTDTRFDKVANYDIATSGVSSTLSSDGGYFYHGGLQVELGVRPFRLRTFPERVLAATREVAVGANGFYDAANSQMVQRLGRPAVSAFANSLGTSVWLGADRNWQQWQTVLPTGVLMNDLDADGDVLRADLLTTPQNGILQLRPNGSFTYTPRLGFAGVDTFTYVASSGGSTSRPTTVTIDVQGSWHNAINGYDVNSDGNVSPLDVLLIINVLNGRNDDNGLLNTFVGYLDVDNDQQVSPVDVLWVINYLNNPTLAGSVGKSAGRDQYFSDLDAEGEKQNDLVISGYSELLHGNRLRTRAFCTALELGNAD